MAYNNPYMTVKVLVTAQVEFTFYTEARACSFAQDQTLLGTVHLAQKSISRISLYVIVCVCVSLLGMMECWDVCMLVLLDHFG